MFWLKVAAVAGIVVWAYPKVRAKFAKVTA